MTGVWLLSWRYVAHHRAQTAILVICLALPVFLPLGTMWVVDRYQSELVVRAGSTPLVAGAKGNRFDLAMVALYFRAGPGNAISWAQLEEIQESGLALPIPINVRHSARGRPIVGTSPEYFELRRLRPGTGTLPLCLGDVVLGARVAEELGLAPGGKLASDQKSHHDISKPTALRMSICGVLRKTGTADDGAVFVDVRTTWVLEGLVHGHRAASKVDPNRVIGKTDHLVHLSPSLIPHQEVTPDNVRNFHYHGPTHALPLSAIIVIPHDLKGRTLLKARFNATKRWQMLEPVEVIEELMGFVFKVKVFLDAYAGVLAIVTSIMAMLVIALSLRLRKAEMRTLDRIGCSRGMVFLLHAVETLTVLVLSVLLASGALLILAASLPQLSKVIE